MRVCVRVSRDGKCVCVCDMWTGRERQPVDKHAIAACESLLLLLYSPGSASAAAAADVLSPSSQNLPEHRQ